MINKYEHIVNASRDFSTVIDRSYTYEFANTAY